MPVVDEDFETGVDGNPIAGGSWTVTGTSGVTRWFNYTDVAGDLKGYYYDDSAAGKLNVAYSGADINATGQSIRFEITVHVGGTADPTSIYVGKVANRICQIGIDDFAIYIEGGDPLENTAYPYVADTAYKFEFVIANSTHFYYIMDGTTYNNGGEFFDATSANLFDNNLDEVSITSADNAAKSYIYIDDIDFSSTRIAAIDDDFDGCIDGSSMENDTVGSLHGGYWDNVYAGLDTSIEYKYSFGNTFVEIDDHGDYNTDMYYKNDYDHDGSSEVATNSSGAYLGLKVTHVSGNGASILVVYGKDDTGLEPVRIRFNQLTSTIQANDNLTFVNVTTYEMGEEYEVRIVYVDNDTYSLWINGFTFNNSGSNYGVAYTTNGSLAGVEIVSWANQGVFYIDDVDFSTTGARDMMPVGVTSDADWPVYAERGNGTPTNPWVISDLYIDTTLWAGTTGISFEGTTDYVLFKNVWIVNSGLAGMGTLTGCSNIYVDDVYIENATLGMAFVSSNNIHVTDAYFTDGDGADLFAGGGIYIDSTDDVVIDDVVISGYAADGFTLADDLGLSTSSNVTVTDFSFETAMTTTNVNGIYFRTVKASELTFDGIDIAGSSIGIYFNGFETMDYNIASFSNVTIHDLLQVPIGISAASSSNVTFEDSTIEANNGAGGGELVDASLGTCYNFSFIDCGFVSATGNEFIYTANCGEWNFTRCSFEGYLTNDSLLYIDTCNTFNFSGCYFESGLNGTTAYLWAPTDINFTGNVYGDYFDQFPYANVTGMSMDILNETYTITSLPVMDAVPLYDYTRFVRNEDVTITFLDAALAPINFADIVAYSNGSVLATNVLHTDAVLYNLYVWKASDNSSILMEVCNVNVTGNAFTAYTTGTFNVTVNIFARRLNATGESFAFTLMTIRANGSVVSPSFSFSASCDVLLSITDYFGQTVYSQVKPVGASETNITAVMAFRWFSIVNNLVNRVRVEITKDSVTRTIVLNGGGAEELLLYEDGYHVKWTIYSSSMPFSIAPTTGSDEVNMASDQTLAFNAPGGGGGGGGSGDGSTPSPESAASTTWIVVIAGAGAGVVVIVAFFARGVRPSTIVRTGQRSSAPARKTASRKTTPRPAARKTTQQRRRSAR